MRRREFVAGLGAMAMTPQSALAQQPTKIKRFAFVHPSIDLSELTVNSEHPGYRAFFEQLRRLGQIEGQNITVDRYSGDGRTDRYDDLVRNVIRTNPDIILTTSPALAAKFKAATNTIPLLVVVNDPVSQGLVSSLSHPGGNVTGVATTARLEVWGKRLALLLEATPKSSNIRLLTTRYAWEAALGDTVRSAAAQTGILLKGAFVDGTIDEVQYRRLFTEMERDKVDALMVIDDASLFPHRELIVDLAAKYRIPAMYSIGYFIQPGGLMTYAWNLTELYNQMAGQADRILRGANPGDVPIYLATRYELVINLKTAKALGLELAETLIRRADEVIE